MSEVGRHQFILALVAGLVFFTNLGGYALFDEDEPKNAVCGMEMYERGDWIVPTFNAELRTDKPILIYWWMNLSFCLLGVSEFSARLGSAILATGAVFLTYHLGRMLYSSSIALMAGIIFATCLMFSAVGRAVTPDATLIFCLMLAFTSYVWVVAKRRGGHFCGVPGGASSTQDLVPLTAWKCVPMYAAMGLAILAKGPIGVLLPCTIIGLFLLISSRKDDVRSGVLTLPAGNWIRRAFGTIGQVMHPLRLVRAGLAMQLLAGAAIVLVVALPWYVVVGLKTDGAWLRGFLGDHNLGRFLEPKENHSGPIFYYGVVLFLGCFPWSVFLPLSVWHLRKRIRNGAQWNDSDRFLACWAGVWFVFFSLARTKLPNYVLPMYPALALIVARFLCEWVNQTAMSPVAFRHCCRVLGAVGVLILVGIPIASSLLFPGEQWLGLIGCVPLLSGSMAYWASLQGQRHRALRILTVNAVVLATLIVGVAPAWIGAHQDSPVLAEAARRTSGKPRPDIAVLDGFSPSLIFYARKPVTGLRKPEDVTAFLDSHPDGFVVTRADRLDRLPASEASLVEVARHRRFLRRYDVVLLSRPVETAARPDAVTRQ